MGTRTHRSHKGSNRAFQAGDQGRPERGSIMKLTKFEPDYITECFNCDQTPTVMVTDEGCNIEHHTELCGPCCFGEAAALDPKNWNINEE